MREDALAVAGEPEPVLSVTNLAVAGVEARLYRPLGDERSILVWLHGGAWILGDLESYDAVVRALANRAGCAVLSVDYRLAPEHPYPAALEDCWAATSWAAGHFQRVAVGGDSAGGNLAAAVALRARDQGLVLAMQLLVYPVLDYDALSGRFVADYERRYETFANIRNFGASRAAGVRFLWETYVPDSVRRSEPYASPLQARSLAGLAPAVIITTEHDILRGEAEDYATRLQGAGVSVELINYEGQLHGFFQAIGVLDDARDALRRCTDALAVGFSKESGASTDAPGA